MGTDREQAIGEGLALIAAGDTQRDAAAACGIPKTTLHRAYVRLLGPNAPDKDAQRQAADEVITALAYEGAVKSLQRIADEVEQADHRGLVSMADTTSKVLSRLRGWDKDRSASSSDTAPRWLNALSQVLDAGGASLTVTVAPVEHNPATPTRDSS